MSGTGRIAAAALLVTLVFVHGPATAAQPERGTLTEARPSVRWSGGPFLVPRPVGCLGPGDSTCDYYFLRVGLAPGSEVEIKLSTARETSGLAPVDGDDFDIYVWGPNDEIIAAGATSEGNESLTFVHTAKLRNYTYEIEVVPFLVTPGSSYTATASALGY